ncbi:c-type cytochrome [Paludibacterium sp.]|uniref:SorB family sulfite dehydrogenase c-type cytochrome subunit n=1 Tax=Paludibacterium sp. TaxID=1917523 RepID=UPI0025E516E4|nr:c-type cytochrome [Paludibacterium sp.]MBV8648884.1 c-type cytochrome [Paludibacterium sp.]
MKPLTTLWCGGALAGMAMLSQAAQVAIALPPETAALRPSPLPGYQVAAQKCATCHSADYINYQPPGMNQAQWTSEAAKMQHAYGAPITDQDVKVIGAYLAVAYGSAQATDADVLAAGPVVAAQGADVMALLNTHGCLACHAIDKKVVGPAYRDVAGKYAHDAEGLSKVMASIRLGGSGKWGEVPMPPFPQLSNEDVQALAAFVLRQ